jgi:hypothetical protein
MKNVEAGKTYRVKVTGIAGVEDATGGELCEIIKAAEGWTEIDDDGEEFQVFRVLLKSGPLEGGIYHAVATEFVEAVQ